MRHFLIFIGVFFVSFFTIAQGLNADFTASSTSVCLGESIKFTSTSTGNNITNYTWNFGNGETSSGQSPTYTYPEAGTYTVTLAIQNSSGQADAEVKTGYITINDAPKTNFSVTGNSCTVPIDVSFTNTTQPSSGNTYTWDFGNGTSSSLAQPSPVNYTTSGTYTVSLTATNTATGCKKTHTQDVNISDFKADFSEPTTICAGASIQFTDQSSAGANLWLWNAGTAGTSTVQNPEFTFPSAGTYTVSLTSMNTLSGCDGTVSKTVQVVEAVSPSFTAIDTAGCSPVVINFQNTSGEQGTYAWNFGDGQTFAGENPPPHTYNGNGAYDVTLVFTDSKGCVDSLVKEEYIQVLDVKAEFSAVPVDGCEPIDVVFTDDSETPSTTTSQIISWKWNLGNGQTATTQNPPMQTYQEGIYDISLIIETANGCKDTIVKTEYIKVGTKQQASFTYDPLISCVKSDIEFTNTSIIDPAVDTTEIEWKWDFGDDENSSDKHPDHAYSKDTGYFDVQLIVDYRGCQDTMKIDSAVYIKAPLSQYYLKDELFCNPTFPITVETIDTSKLGISTDMIDVYWKWGDGTQTHIPNADLHDSDKSSTTHQYSDYGSYTIWHIIVNHTTGCTDSLDKIVNVSKIDAGMTFNDSVCKLSDLSINGDAATSTDPIVQWDYQMGEGGNTSGNPATYAYETSGTYTITQTVTNSVGCSATKAQGPVTVLELPNADFTVTPITQCVPSGVTITNNSTKVGNGVNLASFEWHNYDDNTQYVTTTMADSPNLTFTEEGVNTIGLVAIDAFGCKSEPFTQDFELTKPHAEFSIPAIVCNDTDIEVVNNSMGAPELTYHWLVDGVEVVSGDEFAYQFDVSSPNLSSNHTVGLVVTDVNGCKDTTYQPVTVSLPKPDFSFQGSAASVNQDGSFTCPPVFMQYSDSSQSIGNVVGWNWDFDDNANSSIKKNPDNTFVFPGVYGTTLTITDEYGCVGTVTKNDILVIRGPKANPTMEQSIDQCGQVIKFSMGENSDVASIDWDFGNGEHAYEGEEFTYVYMEPGTYYPSLTIKDETNCETVYPFDPITISPNDVIANFTYAPTEIEMNDNVTFTDASSSTVSPIVKWTWTIYGEEYTSVTSSDITKSMHIPGYTTVTLVVADQYGCLAKHEEEIFVKPKIELPNVMTPNGDGINDYFTLDLDIYKEYDIVILNRWGNVVYSNTSQQGMIIWDGKTVGGDACIDGVYFYKFKGLLNDEQTIVPAEGFFHILGVK